MRVLRYLVSFFTVLALIVVITGCHHNKEKQLYDSLPINTDGNPNGKVILVEFLDYSDPNSAKMAPIIGALMEQRPNVRVIYHPIIVDAAKGYYTKEVLAAGLQDRYLAAHHLLLNTNTSNMSADQLANILAQAFIDPNELQQQAQGAEVAAMEAANQKLANTWDVNSLPTFFVGNVTNSKAPEKLEGLQTLKQLLAAVDAVDSK